MDDAISRSYANASGQYKRHHACVFGKVEAEHLSKEPRFTSLSRAPFLSLNRFAALVWAALHL
mgnify:FL=1